MRSIASGHLFAREMYVGADLRVRPNLTVPWCETVVKSSVNSFQREAFFLCLLRSITLFYLTKYGNTTGRNTSLNCPFVILSEAQRSRRSQQQDTLHEMRDTKGLQ